MLTLQDRTFLTEEGNLVNIVVLWLHNDQGSKKHNYAAHMIWLMLWDNVPFNGAVMSSENVATIVQWVTSRDRALSLLPTKMGEGWVPEAKESLSRSIPI